MTTASINSKNIDNLDSADSLSVGDLEIAGSIEIDGDLTVDGDSLLSSNVGIDTETPLVSLDINTTDAIALPTGTDAERPSGVNGYMRFNTTSSLFEGFNGTWGDLTESLWTRSGDDIFRFSNVGIGVTSAGNLLHLLDTDSGVTPLLKLENTGLNGNSSILFTNDADNWSIGIDGIEADAFKISNNAQVGSFQFVIRTDGDVGIATCPSTRLTVFKSLVSSTEALVKIISGAASQDCAIELSGVDSGTNFSFGIDESDSSKFKISNNSTLGTNDRFVIDGGNLGIANSTPNHPLDVTGDINTSTDYNIGSTQVLSGTTLGSTVVNSSLTSIGTLTSLTISGNLTVDTTTLFVDSSGNEVGIGTNNPGNVLHVFDTNAGTTPVLKLENTGSNEDCSMSFVNDAQTITMGIDGSQFDAFIISDSTALGTNDRFTINSAGLIGIGTNNPSNLLHVFDTNVGTVPLIRIQNTGVNEDASIRFGNDAEDWVIGIDGSDSDNFKISDNVALGTNDRITITTTGNVGIGIAPTQKLHVNGPILVAGTNAIYFNDTQERINSDGSNLIFWASNAERVRFESTGHVGINTSNPTNYLHIYESTTSVVPQLKIHNAGTGDTSILFDSGTDWVMGVDNSDSDRLKIDAGTSLDTSPLISIETGGNVGIGINDPSQKLHVNGAILIASTNYLYLNDTQERIRSDGSNIEFWAGASERMTIEGSGGFVGINTTNPTNLLHVYENSTDNTPKLKIENAGTGDAALHFNTPSNDWIIGIDNSDGDRFKIEKGTLLDTSPTVSMEGGLVGINQNDPSQALHVGGNILVGGTNFIYFNDTNEGIRSNGAVLQFNVGGSERVRFEDTGHVGINTTNPTAYLHLYLNTSAVTPQMTIQNAGTGDTSILFDSGTNWTMGVDNSDSDKFKIDTASSLDTTPYFTIDTSANVGLNQNTPTQRLHVNGNILVSSTNFIYFNDTNEGIRSDGSNVEIWAGGAERMTIEGGGDVGIATTNPIGKLHVYNNTSSTFPMLVLDQDSTGDSSIQFVLDATTWAIGVDNSDSDKFKFSNFTALGTNDRVSITTGGQVGIGTNTPDPGPKLHLFDGSSGGTSNTLSEFTIESSTSNTLQQFLSPTSGIGIIHYGDSGSNFAGFFRYIHSNNSFNFGTNTTSRMTITSAGDILSLTGDAFKTLGSGTWNFPSDKRIKRDIKDVDVDKCLDNIKKIRLRKYKFESWYEKANSGQQDKEYLGIVTQELLKSHPNCVRIENDPIRYDVDIETGITELRDDGYVSGEYKEGDEIVGELKTINIKEIKNIQTIIDSDCLWNENIGAVQCLSNKIDDIIKRLEKLENK